MGGITAAESTDFELGLKAGVHLSTDFSTSGLGNDTAEDAPCLPVTSAWWEGPGEEAMLGQPRRAAEKPARQSTVLSGAGEGRSSAQPCTPLPLPQG